MPILTKAKAKSMGIPTQSLQTIEIPKKTFSLTDGRKWLKQNGYLYQYYRVTPNMRRFMQTPDIKGASYFSKKLPNGIVLVYQTYS